MPYRALYRKYRPKGFSGIVGQQALVQALTGQVASGRISHAYLFSGPRGTGKTSAAKVLARAINCQNNQRGEACGVCRPCVELLSEANMDIVEIDAASNNSVDRVREMIENVKYMPAVGRFRVYIVDEVHMLSTSAFNALLKTLEEPPAHVVFILATTEPHKLPATVLSRCQQFQFRRISTPEMTGMLQEVLKAEGALAEKDALQAIARASGGGMRDALSLLDQCLSLSGDRVTAAQVYEMLGTADSSSYFDIAECLLSGDAGKAVGLLDRFIRFGGDVKTFSSDLCRHMRDLFIASYVEDAAGILDASEAEATALREQAGRHAPGDMLRCLGVLTGLEGDLRYAANPRIPLELALFRCCRVEKEGSYEDLLARVERLEAWLAQGVPAAPPVSAERPLPPQHGSDAPWDDEPEMNGFAQQIQKAAPVFAPAPPAPMPEGSDEQEEDAPPEEDSLPGQMDLFASAPEVSPAAAPRHADEAKPGSEIPAGKLWAKALQALEKSPQILPFAAKGKATRYENGVLMISFTEDDKGAVPMLDEARRRVKIAEAVDAAAGRHVEFKLEITQWSPSQQAFIERSRAVIPKDAKIIIEKE